MTEYVFSKDPSLDHQSRACMRLWSAVMVDGVRAASVGFFAKEEKPCADLRWFQSDEHYPGSWVWLCELFELDPDRARSSARMKFRELARDRKNKADKARASKKNNEQGLEYDIRT